jgi:hypothetical protein
MHRMKIGLVAAAVIVALTVAEHTMVTGPLKDAVTRTVEDEVVRGQLLHSELARLEALDFTNLVATLSRRAGVAAIFDRPDEHGRRQAAFDECEAINARLAAQRMADIVAVVDAQGKVVARNLNADALYGEDVRTIFPPVDAALKGTASHGVVSLSGRMTQLAAAPVMKADGKLLGVLLVGYGVSVRDAEAKHDQLGAHVGYLFKGQVQASSFTEGGGPNAKEDGSKRDALSAALFQQGDKPGAAALAKGSASAPFHVTLDGQDYLAIAAPLYPKDHSAGFVVLQSRSDAAVGETGAKVILFGLLAILVALGATVMTANRFIKPLDKIELGVAEIINGNIDYTFRPVGPDFEGLSNSLNVMLARLLGREEPNEDDVDDDEGGQRWQSDQVVIDEVGASELVSSGTAAADPAMAALASENEGSYYPRLYTEYLAALRAANQPSKGLSVQLFTAKLRLVEGGLKQRWKCKQVRFRLVQRGSEIVLHPVPIFLDPSARRGDTRDDLMR